MLNLRLLGPPGASWSGAPVEIPRRTVRALLYYLAARAGPVPRTELSHIFWGEHDEATARSRLRHTLSQLRQALEAHGAPTEMVAATPETVALDLARSWVDVLEWGELLDSAIRPASLPGEALHVLADRLTEIPSGVFLEGFLPPDLPLFESWLMEERDRFEDRRLVALVGVAQRLIEAGESQRARRLAELAVRADPLREEAHMALVESLARAGERSAALRQYELMKEILERELGVPPLPESEGRYRRLLGETPRPVPASAPTPIPEIPFVGRVAELTALRRTWDEARAGKGRAVLVAGVAGAGKTRLLAEFAGTVSEAQVLQAACYPSTQGLPYHPLMEALRGEAVGTAEPDQTLWPKATFDPRAPETATRSAVGPDPMGQARLWESIARHLEGRTAEGAVLLILNDLQWADPSSLQLLAYMVRRLARSRFLLAGTVRSEDLGRLVAWREEVLRDPGAEWIEIDPLSQGEVLGLVQRLAGLSQGGDRFSRRLHRETEGNPFFLIETLRRMLETGELRRGPKGWQTAFDEITEDYGELPLPESVREAIRGRFGRLTPLSRQVLGAAAVVGREFDLATVRMISGRSEASVVEGLDELRAAWVIRDAGASMRFVHGKFQEVAYEDLGSARRQLLHRRAVESFSRGSRPGRPPAEIAYHAGRADLWAEAADNYSAAAEAARRLFAFTEVAQFEAGLIASLERLGRPPEERLEAWLRLETAHHWLGLREEQAQDHEQLEAMVTASADVSDAWLGEIEFRRGRLRHAASRWREAAGHLEAALVRLPPAGPSAHEASLLLASCRSGLGDVVRAEATALEALATAEQEDDPRAQAACALALADIADQGQRFGIAKEWLDRARGSARQAGDRRLEARALYLSARAEANTGAFDRALDLARQGLNLARPIGLLEEEANCQRVIGIAQSRLNRAIEAIAAYGAAEQIYRLLQRAEGLAMVELNLSDVHLRIADFPASAQYSLSAHRHYGEINSQRGGCASASNHGQALLWMGQAEEAVPWFEKAEAGARALDLRHWLADILGYRGLTDLALGQVESACARLSESLRTIGDEDSVDRCLYRAWLALGWLRRGDGQAGLDLARQAAAEADGRAVDHAQVHFILAMALEADGDLEAARASLTAAQASVDRLLGGLPDEPSRARYLKAFPLGRLLAGALQGDWPRPPRLV